MSFETDVANVRTQILAFATKIKEISQTSQTADNSLHLEGLTLNEVVELIAGSTGLTIQDVQDSLDAHIARTDNPHTVTKAQVGLGNVDNFLTATKAEAVGVSYDYTATAGQTAFTGADLDAEVLELGTGAIVYVEQNGNRLTETTHFTVDVANDTVTLVTGAADGDSISIRVVEQDRFMTATVLWHVLDVFWGNKVGAAPATLDTINELAAALQNNPDIIDNLTAQIATKATQADIDATVAALTKADIGLGNVDNYATATNQEGIDGLATDKFMTPATTKAATDALAASLQTQIDTKVTQADIDASAATLQTAIDTKVAQTDYDTAVANLQSQIDSVNSAQSSMTKADVGLGNVDNFATATDADALGVNYTYTAGAGQTVFTGADNGASVLDFEPGANFVVSIDGVETTAFTSDAAADSITLGSALAGGETVVISVFDADLFMTPANTQAVRADMEVEIASALADLEAAFTDATTSLTA